MATVELRFSALPEHVRTARLVAVSIARRAGVDDETLDEVRLAVGEAATRAVGRHRVSCPSELVLVRLSDGDGRFVAEVVDVARVPSADGVDAVSAEPDLAEHAEADPDGVDALGRAAARGHRPGRDRQPGRRRDRRDRRRRLGRADGVAGAPGRGADRRLGPGRLGHHPAVCVDSARRAVPWRRGAWWPPPDSSTSGPVDAAPQTGGHMVGTALASVGESFSFTTGNVTTVVVVALDRPRRAGCGGGAGPRGARSERGHRPA